MKITRLFVVIALIITSTRSVTGFAQSTPKEFVGEGVVVAFQKYNRYPVMGPVRGVANFVEYWIVRIDKWTNEAEPLKERKYFRVEYNIYERGITDCEINALRLRFKLRELRENEHTDCMGTRREPSDYVRTTPGQLDAIPPLDSLPCLIADQPPIVIPEQQVEHPNRVVMKDSLPMLAGGMRVCRLRRRDYRDELMVQFFLV